MAQLALATVDNRNLFSKPIRRISFTTPQERRAAIVEEAKALYHEFLEAQNSLQRNLIRITVNYIYTENEHNL